MTKTPEDPPDQTSGQHPSFLKLVRSDGEDVATSITPSDDDALVTASSDLGEEAADSRPLQPAGVRELAEELERALTPQTETSKLQDLRTIEAVLFASPVSLHESKIAEHLSQDSDVPALLAQLQDDYAGRGIELKKVAGRWTFRTAEDLAHLLRRDVTEERRLSKAALETLAIIAYHQPVTRAEIEEVRGVSTSSGTLDILLETTWVRMRGRRRAPGRPVTYGTTDAFLEHFGLDTIRDLPGLSDLKGSGLLDPTMPSDFEMPQPTDVAALLPDELPLEDDDEPENDLFEASDTDDDTPDESNHETSHSKPDQES